MHRVWHRRVADRKKWIEHALTPGEDGAQPPPPPPLRKKKGRGGKAKPADADEETTPWPESEPPSHRSFSSFVDDELVHFSIADLRRSLPSAIDGLKPTQRKVLHACFARKLLSTAPELKVSSLAGYVTEKTAYHHGEASMTATIVHMAHNFVGSNNVPLLEACGQFGTRAAGGDDAASARYIFTRLSPITPLLFPAADAPILRYQVEDGQTVEPGTYSGGVEPSAPLPRCHSARCGSGVVLLGVSVTCARKQHAQHGRRLCCC